MDKIKILFIGDSITDVKFNRSRRHLKAGLSYPLQVMKNINSEKKYLPIYKGIASNRCYHVYDRFTRDCINHEPALVVLFIGVNDAWENFHPEDYSTPSRVHMINRPFRVHFDELLRRLTAELPQTEVVVMSPFVIATIAEKMPFKEFLKPYSEYIKVRAEDCGFAYLDLQSAFDEAEKRHAPKELSTDGIHPTTLGHSVIAEPLTSLIQERLKIRAKKSSD